ncbi:MAG: DUF4380 domain-containing protein [Chloroflexi bacterium]|nr:DUF4380 domain-containing protein [Chloroflexota bacterium]
MTTPCSAAKGDFRGWDACFLENGIVRLAAVPDIGGRVMAYDLGPYPFFFVDPNLAGKLFSPEENQGDGSLAAWKNYGGDKTWPSPQGWDTDDQWHGPPDPVLDTGRYTLDELRADGETAVVQMTSPPDPRTGVQITRRLTLQQGSSRVKLDITFKNIKDHPVRWSIWDVAQLRAERRLPDGTTTYESGCIVTTPVNPNSVFPRGFNVMFGAPDNPQWQVDPQTGLFTAPYLWQIGKVGLDSPAGWIAFSNTTEGYNFAERFTYIPGAPYPDGGATVEVWTVGAGQVGNLNYENSGIYLMETEVLSPFFTMEPGTSASFSIEWGACRAGGMALDVSDAGVIVEPLTAQADGDFVRLTGQFGVFDAGDLRLLWLDKSGHIFDMQTRGKVDPFGLVRIDRVLPKPAEARAVELRVLAQGREQQLARAEIN